MPTLAELNAAPPDEFLRLIGGPLEGETWLAQRVLAQRPFASRAALIHAFEQAALNASEAEQICLIASHPDLAGRAAVDGTLSAASQQEQAAAGLDRLTTDEYEQFQRLNSAYRAQFGFPFVICARENTKHTILAAFERRLQQPRSAEITTGIAEVLKILRLRLIDHVTEEPPMKHTISYGKGNIALYRSYAAPLSGVRPVPESAYHGQPNTIFAVDLEVEVLGDVFLPAYTHGDNSRVIPTATITNFALQKALSFTGCTIEQFLHYLWNEYLKQYADMEALRLTASELPYHPVLLTDDAGQTVTPSDRLLAPTFDVHSTAELLLNRSGVQSLEAGLRRIKLIKLTGSAFDGFPRDEFTTLPARVDRPLYIFLEMGWRYADPADALNPDVSRWIPPRQVYDVVAHTFHNFVSMSIQHLLHEFGRRLLDRFPQMDEVWFRAQNRLWDTAAEADGCREKVFMDPRPPYGHIRYAVKR
jgi:urate oxidase/2-oxo-4-hydroxy-4-carboxy-5-ureidoimidazoline decarboxylase